MYFTVALRAEVALAFPFLQENVRESLPSWNSPGSSILGLKSSLDENVSGVLRSQKPVQGTHFKTHCLLSHTSSEDLHSFGNGAEKIRVQVKCFWQFVDSLHYFPLLSGLLLDIPVCFPCAVLTWLVLGVRIGGGNLVEYHPMISRGPNSSHCFFMTP